MKANEKEFEQIVATYKRTIYTVCYMFSKNEDEVNDLFQNTLVNLWKGMEAFKEQSKLDTWIYRVALNTCISQERKKKRKSARVPMEMDISLYQDNDADTLQVQMLHKRIGRLGMVDRAIVLLWLEDLSYEEIGQIVGISATHVGVKLYRIKELLKRN
ncbi:MAG: RNA polymerase sigma factor [Bacteroidaceae bacterium]